MIYLIRFIFYYIEDIIYCNLYYCFMCYRGKIRLNYKMLLDLKYVLILETLEWKILELLKLINFYYMLGIVYNKEIRNNKIEVIFILALNVFNYDFGMEFLFWLVMWVYLYICFRNGGEV